LLIFRDENEKAVRLSERRRARTQSLPESGTTSNSESGSSQTSRLHPVLHGSRDPSAQMLSGLDLPTSYPWIKAAPSSHQTLAEDQAVSQFFEKYVMYPCNNRSSPGFLEHLPVLFHEAKVEGRLALRWAVRAAAYASLANDQSNSGFSSKALECYGLALSALGDALLDRSVPPDDYALVTVVVLDIFEVGHMYSSFGVFG
jgi:hypothetical protein